MNYTLHLYSYKKKKQTNYFLLVSRKDVSRLFKDTTLIEDKDLSYEVYLVKSFIELFLYNNFR